MHSVEQRKHGNAKKKTHNYCKIKPSVKRKAANSLENSARCLASNVKDIGGSIEQVTNPADVINRKLLYNIKHNEKQNKIVACEDELSQLIDMAHSELGYFVSRSHVQIR